MKVISYDARELAYANLPFIYENILLIGSKRSDILLNDSHYMRLSEVL